jgi:hypothetical protein
MTSPGGGDLGVHVVELVLAALFALGGLRSLRRWMALEFQPRSGRDNLLYLLHATARVGMWFAFSGFFVGYALVAEPWRIRWYVMVPICLASVQLLTGAALARVPEGMGSSIGGKGPGVDNDTPGPLEPEKEGATADPGHPQPEAAEVESARLLANQAREGLRGAGLSDQQIRRLADRYIAEDRGEELTAFIDWAKAHASS